MDSTRYGCFTLVIFTETKGGDLPLQATFNFQQNNFGKGGVGNDRVTASVQDSAGVDNADFATPPE